MHKSIVNPSTMVKPVGFAHGVATSGGTTVYLAGQISCDTEGKVLHAGNLVLQFDNTLANLFEVVKAAGGVMTDIVKLNIFVTDKEEYKKNLHSIGASYRKYFGKYFPAMTLVEVVSLFEDEALIEIEGIAVIDR